jgi:glutamate-1-semialdehyde 2,1-aminomutase
VDLVRFANSGTEATMHAFRIARGYTGREKILKFEGQYHGMHDYVLWSTASASPAALGSRRDPIKVQQSSGIPAAIRDLVLSVPYNDFELLEATLRREGHQTAAIVVEPILGNSASIGPKEGWLEFLRQKCDEYGIVLIFDEVKTGFRIAPGGAQEFFGVQADLVTYAKAIANGFPLAAIGGKREVMEVVGRGVSQGGTYCANAVGVAAADATLELLEDGQILKAIDAQGNNLKAGISEILTEAGIAHHVKGPGAMFGILFMEDEPWEFRDMRKHNGELYEAIATELVVRGVIPDPDAREPWFLCAAHDDAAIEETLAIFAVAVEAVQDSGLLDREPPADIAE